MQKDPSNVSLIDQLGEFYRRHGHYVLAMETWCCGLALPRSDALWTKILFWLCGLSNVLLIGVSSPFRSDT